MIPITEFSSEVRQGLQLTIRTIVIAIALGGLILVAGAQQPGPLSPPSAKAVESEDQGPAAQAAAFFERGQQAHEAGKLEEAVRLYSEALERDPSLWQAEYQRGVAYFSLGKLTEARAAMMRTIQLLSEFTDSPQRRAISARVQSTLGEIALAEANPAEAERAFRRALELSPSSGRAHVGLAEVFLSNRKFAEAAAEAKAAIAAGEDRASIYLLLGQAQMLSGQDDEAMASLNEALKREPQMAVALCARAELLLKRNDLPRAITDLQAALALAQDTPMRLRLADAFRRAKREAEAITLYRQVLEAEPNQTEARAALVALLIESGKSSEAVAELEALIKTDPNRAVWRGQLAELYLATQPEKALEQYAAAAKLEPAQPSYQIGLGAALVKLRRFQQAISVLKQVLERQPNADLAYFAHTNLATAFFELEDYPNAAREFVWILDHQHDPKRTAIALYFLGICFDKLGDYEQALKAYERFLSLASPDNQLEIDKVKLRLPSLKRQIKEGKGQRKK